MASWDWVVTFYPYLYSVLYMYFTISALVFFIHHTFQTKEPLTGVMWYCCCHLWLLLWSLLHGNVCFFLWIPSIIKDEIKCYLFPEAFSDFSYSFIHCFQLSFYWVRNLCSVSWMKHRRKQRTLPIAFTFYSGESGEKGIQVVRWWSRAVI